MLNSLHKKYSTKLACLTTLTRLSSSFIRFHIRFSAVSRSLNKQFLIKEFKARPWNSRLQLIIGGVLMYLLAVFAGPQFGCGAGLVDYSQGSFSCRGAAMPLDAKIKIVAVIAFASLCWGRAMSLAGKPKAPEDTSKKTDQ